MSVKRKSGNLLLLLWSHARDRDVEFCILRRNLIKFFSFKLNKFHLLSLKYFHLFWKGFFFFVCLSCEYYYSYCVKEKVYIFKILFFYFYFLKIILIIFIKVKYCVIVKKVCETLSKEILTHFNLRLWRKGIPFQYL